MTVAERLAAGSLAGAVSTAACYPLDTLKSQMAVRGGLRGSALAAAAQMFREQGGARAFYKGLGPTLVADIIGTGLGFTLYDSFVGWYRRVVGGRKAHPGGEGRAGRRVGVRLSHRHATAGGGDDAHARAGGRGKARAV